MTIEKMLEQKDALTPKSGFRLCGLDDFQPPGEQLYPISEHATREEAEAAREAVIKERGDSNDDPLFIYTIE